jgi:hypothetical protein
MGNTEGAKNESTKNAVPRGGEAVRIEIARPVSVKLYRAEQPWYGIRDPDDDTIVAMFWSLEDAEACTRKWSTRYKVVELRITEDDE